MFLRKLKETCMLYAMWWSLCDVYGRITLEIGRESMWCDEFGRKVCYVIQVEEKCMLEGVDDFYMHFMVYIGCVNVFWWYKSWKNQVFWANHALKVMKI